MPICLAVKPPLRLLAAALILCAVPQTVYAETRSRSQIDPALDVLGIGRFVSVAWLAEISLSEHEQK